jgi:hypothetical protein
MGEEWIANYIIEQLSGGAYTTVEELTPELRDKLKCPKCGSLVWELYDYSEYPEYVGELNLEDGDIDEADDIIDKLYIIKCDVCDYEPRGSILPEED